ncbi:MAG: hypothetical protein RLY49_200 [Candidatus Parcubacteria bacterium]|jgi:hypothetical protein
MKYRYIILSVLIVSVFVFVNLASSQSSETAQTSQIDLSSLFDSNTGLPTGIDEQISVDQTPRVPKPGEIVEIRITSYMTDLNKAKITWTQDGKVLVSQTGATVNQVQAPTSGKSTQIVITIEKEKGGTITKTITLNPADVDLLYEAQTYSPPFFKGKSLFTSESVISFIAVPNFVTSAGAQIAAENLIYTWSINGTVQQAISGYGKNTFTTKGSLIERPMKVSVEVSAINSTLKASQELTIKSTKPEVVIYENNPLLGIVYEHAVRGNFLLKRAQVDFEAIPYSFATLGKNSTDLTYAWSINGTKVTSKNPTENYLVLQNTENKDGTAVINVNVKQNQNILQNAFSNLQLDFKKVKDTSNEAINF